MLVKQKPSPQPAPDADLFLASGLESAPLPAEPELSDEEIVAQGLAEVAVDGPVRGTFTYLAGSLWNKLRSGARVVVPFGHRQVEGFYIGERTLEDLRREKINLAKLKPIARVLDEESEHAQLLTPNLLALAHWMSRHYACPLGGTLSAMLPAGVKRGSEGARVRFIIPTQSPEELIKHADAVAEKKPKQAALLQALAAHPNAWQDGVPQAVNATVLMLEAEAPDSALKALEKAGLVRINQQRAAVIGAPVEVMEESPAMYNDLALNDEQKTALARIELAMESEGICKAFLLQGVTGSGKTEVYIRALKTALARGKQGIVLVPEIALTPQTSQRFEGRLGRERVAVLHSHITDGERAEAWRAIRAGKIDVVVGARSAIFAPLPRLGIIIIDEEHENAFKQESTPRYHARDVAMELARLSNAALVLGSATPSFEAIHAAKTGKLQTLTLSRRVAERPMPPVELIDMNEENRDTGKYNYLSRRLLAAIENTLSRGEQSILFMNRRGWATVITCLRCGQTEKCIHCDITLTSHKQTGRLICHYCDYNIAVPEFCSGCGAPGLKHWGMGTERIEAEVLKAFPSARVARMDSDTMSRRTAYLEALGNFRARKTDILVGTQMIAKGLDFPNVTLVGVVLADTALHMPDFRSRERTFQLLAQVAGRAGRSEKGGKVLIQTHLPGDPAIRAASRHDFETFALAELKERKAFSYPPFTRLARVIIRGKDAKATRVAAESIATSLRAHPLSKEQIKILGPAEAPISKLEGFYRQHIMLKGASSEALSELFGSSASEVIGKLKGAEAVVDVDAVSML